MIFNYLPEKRKTGTVFKLATQLFIKKPEVMKKLFLVMAAGVVLAACGDHATDETGTGGSIDSNYSAPDQTTTPDNTNVHPDSVRLDSSNMSPQGGDGNPSAR